MYKSRIEYLLEEIDLINKAIITMNDSEIKRELLLERTIRVLLDAVELLLKIYQENNNKQLKE